MVIAKYRIKYFNSTPKEKRLVYEEDVYTNVDDSLLSIDLMDIDTEMEMRKIANKKVEELTKKGEKVNTFSFHSLHLFTSSLK